MRRVLATLRATCVAACLLAAALVVPAVASANVIYMDLPALTSQATNIVVVHVARQSSEASGPMAWATRPIRTDSILQVQRVLKGSEPSTMTLTQPGGTVGFQTTRVSDLPNIEPGETCILFLDANGNVVGGYQGKLQVERGQVPALGTSFGDTIAAIRDNGVAQPEQPSHASANSGVTSQQSASGTAALVGGPAIGSIAPPGANAGTGERVTISGSGFGATQGGVTFPSGTHDAPIAASIVSWSDTSIVCEVPSGAESGSSAQGVVVTRASDTAASAAFHYSVGFSYSGLRWNSPSIAYRVDDNCPDVSNTLPKIKAAMAVWNGAGSTFRYTYGGTTNVHTQPDLPDAAGYPDSVNEIYWSTGFGVGIIGWNAYSYSGGSIQESDIVLNAATPYYWAMGAVPDTIDVQTAVTHELGHTQQLDDQYDDTAKVMGALVLGHQKLALSTAEHNGTMYLWGQPTLSLSSATDPAQGTWYGSHSATFGFTEVAPVVANGYSVVLDASPNTVPPATVNDAVPSFSTASLSGGDNWLHVRARSIFGIWGPSANFLVRVDVMPPVTTSDALPSYPSTSTITLEATDVGSGVAKTSYSADGGVWTDGTQVTVGGYGTHTLSFASVDNFGNAETTQTVSFTMGDGIHLSDTTMTAGWGSSASALNLQTLPYGGTAPLVGALTDGTGTPMADEPSPLVIAEYFDGSAWKKAGKVATGSAPGEFVFGAAPRVRTQYRLHFLGDWENTPSVSAVRVALPAANLSKPSLPKSGKRTKSITVSGVLAPAGRVGSTSTVKLSVYQWRRVRGKNRWSLRKTVWTKLYARDADSSKYAATFRIKSAGKWSVIASAPTNASNAAAGSSRSSTITIR